MTGNMKAPEISRYIDYLGNHSHLGNPVTYDEKTYRLLDEIFALLSRIEPATKNGARKLWLKADRGTIDDFGDYEELLDYGEVKNYEEFERMWKDYFPDEIEWYELTAIRDEETGYRGISLANRFVIVDSPNTEHSSPRDISEFAEWLRDAIQDCINELEAGTYNESVQRALPAKHRIGTILRKDLWDVFPDAREAFFMNISKEDVDAFIAYMNKQGSEYNSVEGRIKEMTANDFYTFCSLGYQANRYEGIELTPKAQYYKHADGRDDGLSDIDPHSPSAFAEWHQDKNRRGGHPWEVCRGGNSTHVSLYVHSDENGYFLSVAGSSEGRCIEAIHFYLALKRAGLPVYMHDGDLLVDRLLEREKIGIVPEGVIPSYCHSLFPNERIIDFMNLPYENAEKVASKCTWQVLREVRLI